MSFPYDTSVPNPPNAPATDINNMQTNTLSIFNLIKVDHLGFNQTDPQGGYHTVVHFFNQNGNPPDLSVGQLYTKTVGTPSSQQLFFKSGTTNIVSQLTANVTPSANTNGYTYLPGGLILQWGVVTAATHNMSVDVNFSASNIDFPTNCFQIIGSLSAGTTGAVLTLKEIDKTQFNYYINTNSSQTINFSWFAIGN